MTIVGFSFTKFVCERKDLAAGKIGIKNNIVIKDVNEIKLPLGKNKEDGLKFIFQFVSNYTPDIGNIEITGELMYLGKGTEVTDILKEWKKAKKVPQEVMQQILNQILTRCNIQALVLSRDINLPPPIPLPRVGAQPAPANK